MSRANRNNLGEQTIEAPRKVPLTLLSRKIPWLSSALLSARQRSTTSLLHFLLKVLKSPWHTCQYNQLSECRQFKRDSIFHWLWLKTGTERNEQQRKNYHYFENQTLAHFVSSKKEYSTAMSPEKIDPYKGPGSIFVRLGDYLKVCSKNWPHVFLYLSKELRKCEGSGQSSINLD